LKALLARKEQFGGPKSFLEGTKDRVVEKLDVYSDGTGGKAQKTSKETQLKGRLSARGAYLRDSEEFSPILAL
jgi:hypothetical protein